MRAADTNVLVRLLTGDDPKQVSVAEAFLRGGVWVSHLVAAETMWVLEDSYDYDSHDIADAVELLLTNESIALEDHAVVKAALAQYRLTPRLGFSDCLILEIAKKAGHVPLGTFDRHLSRREGTERL
ncbi:MAG TPA: type II toxin-antitoxin system VapC family toxin [Thermoanaerobaculia bacterium]|jgi:predicted nucleic-acid-binding protein